MNTYRMNDYESFLSEEIENNTKVLVTVSFNKETQTYTLTGKEAEKAVKFLQENIKGTVIAH